MSNPSLRSQLNFARANAPSTSGIPRELQSRSSSAKTETKRRSIAAWKNLHSYFKQEVKPLFRTGYNAVEVHLDDNDCVVSTAIRRKSA